MGNDIHQLKEWLWPVVIASGIILFGIILQRIIVLYIQRISKRTNWRGGQIIIGSFRGMLILISVLAGTYVGLTYSPLPSNVMSVVQKLHTVFEIFIVTFVVARMLTAVFKAYTLRERGMERSLSLFNTIIKIIVYCIGGLIILQALGISITPIITALGVGGLAVALALQDTLSNLFGGINLTATHVLKPGDYIVLNTGEEGTVSDITWRYTTLLTQSNNLVVIPNSKLAAAIVTNYSLPQKNLDITIPFGVSYDSDLEKVERVTMEIAKAIMDEFKIPDASPTFRVKEFGTQAVNCAITFTVHNFMQQYAMKHQLMKTIHTRFKKEGIVIPYPPLNTVYLKKD